MIQILSTLINIFSFGLFGYVILSWIRTPKTMEIERALGKIYEPLLEPIRMLLNPIQGSIGLDFSPIILVMLLQVFESSVVNLL